MMRERSEKARSAQMFGLRVAVLFAIVGAGALAAGPGAALAAGDVNNAQCGVETESSLGFRAYLPDCRAYELVTPPYQEGGIVIAEPAAVSKDGSQVIAGSGGAFAGTGNSWLDEGRNPDGATYELTRGRGGWSPTELTPPASEYPHSTLMAVNAEDFETTLWGAAPTALRYNEDIYLRTGDGRFHLVGPGVGPEVSDEEIGSASEELDFAGASRDLTHLLFQVEAFGSNMRADHHGHGNVWFGDTTKPEAPSLYEYVYTGAEDHEPTLVGVKNIGLLHGSPNVNDGAELISDCGTKLGSGRGGSAYNAVSESGAIVFFTAMACGGAPAVDELYARVNQSETIKLTDPPPGECSVGEPCSGAVPMPAVFQGASENGEHAFFLSEQPLVNGAPTAGEKLYEATLEVTPERSRVSRLVDVSADPTSGESPEVQGVVRVSEIGERVYFVAKGVLTSQPDPSLPAGHQVAETGADNLYVYEPEPSQPGTYRTVFVATLLTLGEEGALVIEEDNEQERVEKLATKAGRRAAEEAESHGVEEREAKEIGEEVESQQEQVLRGTLGPYGTRPEDQSVWEVGDRRPAQATPDGEFLVFLSSAELTKGDKSKVPQLFEYDASSESLTRVSIGEGGQSSGNVETFHDSPRIPEQSFSHGVDLPTAADTGLAVSNDGSTVFFASSASLAPQAEAGTTNIYEYREGDVYLLSGGDDASSYQDEPTVALFGIDPSGQDALFVTSSQLVPQDSGTQEALYDARERGGFPTPVLEPGCIGETCRGPMGATPQAQSPGSTGQAGGGNIPPLMSAAPVTVKPKLNPRRSKCRSSSVKRHNKCVKRRGSKNRAKAGKSGGGRRARR
jgi:hypothetical protein